MKISIKKEKAIVFIGALGAAFSGYLFKAGFSAEAGLVGAVVACVLAFWSEGVNTEQSA